MRKTKVFLDSDVVISSLLSQKGAAYLLLHQKKDKFSISNVSKKEIDRVAGNLKINQDKLHNLIQKRFKIIKLTVDLTRIKKSFSRLYQRST